MPLAPRFPGHGGVGQRGTQQQGQDSPNPALPDVSSSGIRRSCEGDLSPQSSVLISEGLGAWQAFPRGPELLGTGGEGCPCPYPALAACLARRTLCGSCSSSCGGSRSSRRCSSPAPTSRSCRTTRDPDLPCRSLRSPDLAPARNEGGPSARPVPHACMAPCTSRTRTWTWNKASGLQPSGPVCCLRRGPDVGRNLSCYLPPCSPSGPLPWPRGLGRGRATRRHPWSCIPLHI